MARKKSESLKTSNTGSSQDDLSRFPEALTIDAEDVNATLKEIAKLHPDDLEVFLSLSPDTFSSPAMPPALHRGAMVLQGQIFTSMLSLIDQLKPVFDAQTLPPPSEEVTLETLAHLLTQLLPEAFADDSLPQEMSLGQIVQQLIKVGALENPKLTVHDLFQKAQSDMSDGAGEGAKNAGSSLPDLLEWARTEIQAKESPKKRKMQTLPFGSRLEFTNDNIHLATIGAIARAEEWQDSEEDGYFKGLQQEYNNLTISIALPNSDKASSLWDFLRKSGPATIKAHYALWARYYLQCSDGLELQYVVININDFCRDLGYTKHVKGGYKPEVKRRAMELLEALTTTELIATYQTPGSKKGQTKLRRLRGPIWQRGIVAEEKDTYEDLFGQAREGDPSQWVPKSFSFSPGPWHADKEWRRSNQFVGKIGAGIMQLDTRYDEWPILIGGYLGALSRRGQYKTRCFIVATILDKTGLSKSIGARKSQFRGKFYRALDRLVETGVIKSYQTQGFDESEVDMDDADAVAEYGAKDPYPPGDWRKARILIDFGFEDQRERLVARQANALNAKTKRKKEPKT